MSETKADKEAREKHEEFEKQQADDGIAVHLPRQGEPGSPGYVAPDSGKKKASEK